MLNLSFIIFDNNFLNDNDLVICISIKGIDFRALPFLLIYLVGESFFWRELNSYKACPVSCITPSKEENGLSLLYLVVILTSSVEPPQKGEHLYQVCLDQNQNQ